MRHFSQLIPIHNLADNPLQINTLENGDVENFMGIHRHNFCEIIWFTATPKENYLELDFVTHEIKSNQIFFVSPGQVIHKALDQEKGFVLAVNSDIFKDCCGYYNAVLDGISPFVISEDVTPACEAIVNLFESEYSKKRRLELLKSYLKSICLLLEEQVVVNQPYNSDMHRIQKLIMLIEQHYLVEKETSFYSSKLNMSNHHLNDIIRKNRATTVKKMITDRTILEAKRELSYASVSIKELSHKLGFENIAYFSRFFKNQTGYSPEQFKKNQNPQFVHVIPQ